MSPRPPLLRFPNSRSTGVAATLLAHAALVAAWHQARKLPAPDEREPAFVQWVQVAPHLPQESVPDEMPVRAGRNAAPVASAAIPTPQAVAHDAMPAPVPSTVPAAPDAGADGVRRMIEQARLDAGGADRALRKEGKPTIVAPPDSPQIRMANRFREAAALAPNRWYEAPKIVELVNDGGDGARRFRVLTAAGIYCVTERSPATSIDMIEKHGKQRITNCGHEHEQPANPQEWRTARD